MPKSGSSLRVVYFGLPLGALLLAADGHALELVALSRKDVGLRRAERLFGPRLVYKPDVASPELRARVEAAKPDLVVSWFWTTKLPMEVVGVAPFGGIGVHPSLLPRHRGPDPCTWAILAGDVETGVTVHRLAAEYDTGEIIDQERLAIDPVWNSWHLAKALDRPSLRLLRKSVLRFAKGERIVSRRQNQADATVAPFVDDEATAIRWDVSTVDVLKKVRAFAPAPGAWTEIADRLVVVGHAEGARRYPKILAPGEGAVFEGRALVRTNDGAVVLLAGEIDGEPADAAALAALFT